MINHIYINKKSIYDGSEIRQKILKYKINEDYYNIYLDLKCLKDDDIYAAILAEYEKVLLSKNDKSRFLTNFSYCELNSFEIYLKPKDLKSLILQGYEMIFTESIKKSGLTYNEFCSLKTSVKYKSNYRKYALETFSIDELIDGNISKKIPIYLNQLFNEKQLTKQQLIKILDSPEFKKKTKVLGSKITTRESALRSMIKQQDNCDGEIVEAFYNKFSTEDNQYTLDCLQFIKKTKSIIEKCKKGMSDNLKLMLELM